MKQTHNIVTAPIFWRNSLAGKFVTLTVIVVFILMSISAYISYLQQEKASIENLRIQNNILGNFIASIAPEALLSYDYDALNEYMKEIGNGEDVVYAAIFAPNSEALAYFVQRRNSSIASLINDSNEIDIKYIIDTLSRNKDIISQRFPVVFEKKVLGNFVVGISDYRLTAQIRNKLLGTMLVSTIFSILLGFGIYIVFRINTLRPIMQLMQGAHRIAVGEYDKEVHVYSHDELGRLALTFNRMMQQVRQTNEEKDAVLNEIQELNQTLEHRVEQRTRELEIAYQKLEKLALHDSLTNLPNRFCVQDNLNRGIADAKLTGATFTVIMIDLDRFKEINDTLGHDCGDQLLVDVGRRLQSVLRPTDLIGRLGGDEFAILLPDTDETGATVVAQKILAAMEPAFYVAELAFNIGASLGIATYPQHGSTTSALLKSADVAMYNAKNHKLGYCLYNPMADINTPDRLSLMSELREAIQNNELMLYYQPKVDLASRQFIGAEALLRWQHKERGFISPEEFIPMAEQSGLIRRLTYWVINTALEHLESWHNDNLQLSISINLSMHNLQDTEFPAQLARLLEKSTVEHHYIQFEITESVIMSHPDYVLGVLAKLGKMGVKFSIDDFGTGYSSLSMLKKLPVQDIKIDKSFVMDMATDKDDEAIVHSIIDMGHTLGLSVTAEGVENETAMKQLMKLGCDMMQGYFISRPLPVERITQLLRSGQDNDQENKFTDVNLSLIKGKHK